MAPISISRGTCATAKPELTQERLKELLHYDPETGVFTWKSGKRIGSVCASPDKDGYLRVQINSKTLKLHRLSFLYMTGNLPAFQVDHIDGCKTNNKWSNLRDVSAGANQQNRRVAQKGASAGHLGVYKNQLSSKFTARISLGGNRVFLGNFPTAGEAHDAYLEAKRQMHEGCTI